MAVPANLELGPGKTLRPVIPTVLATVDGAGLAPHRPVASGDEQSFRGADPVLDCGACRDAGRQIDRLYRRLCLYLPCARVLYVPAYAFGWVPWRSLIWAVGLVATLLLLVAALL